MIHGHCFQTWKAGYFYLSGVSDTMLKIVEDSRFSIRNLRLRILNKNKCVIFVNGPSSDDVVTS
jgi:hypothetical protein